MIYGVIKENDEESPSLSPEDLWSTKIAPKLANSLEKAAREKYRQEVTALLENLNTQTGACVTIQKQAKMWLELKKSAKSACDISDDETLTADTYSMSFSGSEDP